MYKIGQGKDHSSLISSWNWQHNEVCNQLHQLVYNEQLSQSLQFGQNNPCTVIVHVMILALKSLYF